MDTEMSENELSTATLGSKVRCLDVHEAVGRNPICCSQKHASSTSGRQVLAPKNAAGGKKTIEEIYQKKTQLEHILLRPDTYIGSTEKQQQQMWIMEGDRMVQQTISYVPGLYKIFDEILVNAADNKARDPSMDLVKVDINPVRLQAKPTPSTTTPAIALYTIYLLLGSREFHLFHQETNTVSVWNNGNGVPVEVHKEEGVYVPELIFGHLLTSSNYDDNEKKVTGGRNGYGAKLANIFSSEFIIETCDGQRQRRYRQVFNNNMSKKGPCGGCVKNGVV